MNGKKELIKALRAGYAFFYCQTEEMDRTVETILDAVDKFENTKGENPFTPEVWDFETDPDPEACLQRMDESSPGTVVLAKNLNWFLNDRVEGINKNMIQFIQNRFEKYSMADSRKALVVVSNESFSNAIPEQVASEFMVINFSLPDVEEIREVYDWIVDSAKDLEKFKEPSKKQASEIVESSRGMTRRGVQNAMTYALIDGDGEINPKTVANLRAKGIEETAGLQVGQWDIDELCGYDNVKDFARATIDNVMAKGIMLLGPPGTGKTHFGKWLSTISNKLMIVMDPSSLVGEGLYGQAENAWQNAIDRIKAFGQCILFIDEIEKALSGVSKDVSGDSTGQRSASKFLKFLSDERPEGVYVIATCNNISKMPPEWVRAERWDCAPFFIDLPNEEERAAIYEYYLNYYKVETGGLSALKMDGWSGAEIRSVCRIAAMMKTDCKSAARYVVPVSKTMKEDIDWLRSWSKDKTIPATTKKPTSAKKKRVRAMDL